MTPTVSIVLPTFDRLPYLRQAIDSVFAQTYADWELIIADDGSACETAAYLAGLTEHPRVRLLKLPHTGNPSAVRNAALREARGRYIAFLDSDDVWLPAKLELQLEAHAGRGSRRWSYSSLTSIDDQGRPIRVENNATCDGAIFEQLLTLEACVTTPSVLAERSLIEQAGGFDEEQLFFEDYDLWLRLSLLSDVTLVNKALVQVRNHKEHYSADRIRVYEARFRLLNKMDGHAGTARLRGILRMERAKNAASLAVVSAAAGRRAGALGLLWRSRECAWDESEWWRKAAYTLGYTFIPVRWREAIGRHRRNLRAPAAG